jgi:hypothetical protein
VFQRIELFTAPLAPSGRSDVRRKNSREAARRAHSGKPASIKASRIFERADLVRAHEAAVALHVCCEDRDEASAH